jgi:hypothetical protein
MEHGGGNGKTRRQCPGGHVYGIRKASHIMPLFCSFIYPEQRLEIDVLRKVMACKSGLEWETMTMEQRKLPVRPRLESPLSLHIFLLSTTCVNKQMESETKSFKTTAPISRPGQMQVSADKVIGHWTSQSSEIRHHVSS